MEWLIVVTLSKKKREILKRNKKKKKRKMRECFYKHSEERTYGRWGCYVIIPSPKLLYLLLYII